MKGERPFRLSTTRGHESDSSGLAGSATGLVWTDKWREHTISVRQMPIGYVAVGGAVDRVAEKHKGGGVSWQKEGLGWPHRYVHT